MAANGISTLATKELRQIAKLDLAQTKRQTADTPGYRYWNTYDITALPAPYTGNTPVDSVGPLVAHRPWTSNT